jgi:hypothetical protein
MYTLEAIFFLLSLPGATFKSFLKSRIIFLAFKYSVGFSRLLKSPSFFNLKEAISVEADTKGIVIKNNKFKKGTYGTSTVRQVINSGNQNQLKIDKDKKGFTAEIVFDI